MGICCSAAIDDADVLQPMSATGIRIGREVIVSVADTAQSSPVSRHQGRPESEADSITHVNAISIMPAAQAGQLCRACGVVPNVWVEHTTSGAGATWTIAPPGSETSTFAATHSTRQPKRGLGTTRTFLVTADGRCTIKLVYVLLTTPGDMRPNPNLPMARARLPQCDDGNMLRGPLDHEHLGRIYGIYGDEVDARDARQQCVKLAVVSEFYSGMLPIFAVDRLTRCELTLPGERRRLQAFIPRREGMQIFVKIASAVLQLHNEATIHANIKPSNVLVSAGQLQASIDTTGSGRPELDIDCKLVDYDVSSWRGTNSMHRLRTWHGDTLGGADAYFVSPEELRGQRPAEAADVFALGVLLHCLLFKTVPFGLKRNAGQEGGKTDSTSAARLQQSKDLEGYHAFKETAAWKTGGAHDADILELLQGMLCYEVAQRPRVIAVLEHRCFTKWAKEWQAHALRLVRGPELTGLSTVGSAVPTCQFTFYTGNGIRREWSHSVSDARAQDAHRIVRPTDQQLLALRGVESSGGSPPAITPPAITSPAITTPQGSRSAPSIESRSGTSMLFPNGAGPVMNLGIVPPMRSPRATVAVGIDGGSGSCTSGLGAVVLKRARSGRLARPTAAVVVVVDNTAMRDMFMAVLAKVVQVASVTMKYSTDGADAVDWLRNNVPQMTKIVVFLDVHLCGLSGLSVARAITARSKSENAERGAQQRQPLSMRIYGLAHKPPTDHRITEWRSVGIRGCITFLVTPSVLHKILKDNDVPIVDKVRGVAINVRADDAMAMEYGEKLTEDGVEVTVVGPEGQEESLRRVLVPTKLGAEVAGYRHGITRGTDTNGHKVINEYTVEREVGRGAFGVVYLVSKPNTSQRFAMKECSIDNFKHIQEEAIIMTTLNHPNLVQATEILGDDPQRCTSIYYVMEYVEGGAICKVSGDGSCTPVLPQSKARKVLLKVTDGLAYLHGRNIIHRDIKPDNILATKDLSVVKLGDFGVSVALPDENDTLSKMSGTVMFNAPEMIHHSAFGGRACDIWALGITLHMLVYGRPPFAVHADLKQMWGSINAMPAVLAFPTVTSPTFEAMLQGMLEKDPLRRWTMSQIKNCAWMLGQATERFSDTGRAPQVTSKSRIASSARVKRVREHVASTVNMVRASGALNSAAQRMLVKSAVPPPPPPAAAAAALTFKVLVAAETFQMKEAIKKAFRNAWKARDKVSRGGSNGSMAPSLVTQPAFARGNSASADEEGCDDATLKLCQLEIQCVNDGRSAVEMFRKTRFVAVVTQLHMEKLSGYDAVKEMHNIADADKQKIPFYAALVTTTPQLSAACRSEFDDVYAAPFITNDAVTVLTKIGIIPRALRDVSHKAAAEMADDYATSQFSICDSLYQSQAVTAGDSGFEAPTPVGDGFEEHRKAFWTNKTRRSAHIDDISAQFTPEEWAVNVAFATMMKWVECIYDSGEDLPKVLPFRVIKSAYELTQMGVSELSEHFHNTRRWPDIASSALSILPDLLDRCPFDDEGVIDAPGPHALRAVCTSKQGRRDFQEDVCFTAVLDSGGTVVLACVLDGHMGKAVAQYVAADVLGALFEPMQQSGLAGQPGALKELGKVVKSTFKRIDERICELCRVVPCMAGSTACMVLVDNYDVLTANVGDSAAVMGRRTAVVVPGESDLMISSSLTKLHRPCDPEELALVQARGANVFETHGALRVNGMLAVTRAFGSVSAVPYITAEPEVKLFPRTPDDNFIVVMTDGVHDYYGPDDATQAERHEDLCGFIEESREYYDTTEQHRTPHQLYQNVCDVLLEEVTSEDVYRSMDNASAAIIFFPVGSVPLGDAVSPVFESGRSSRMSFIASPSITPAVRDVDDVEGDSSDAPVEGDGSDPLQSAPPPLSAVASGDEFAELSVGTGWSGRAPAWPVPPGTLPTPTYSAAAAYSAAATTGKLPFSGAPSGPPRKPGPFSAQMAKMAELATGSGAPAVAITDAAGPVVMDSQAVVEPSAASEAPAQVHVDAVTLVELLLEADL
jgi:[calcium/calmodulin-dependent protein kinase] kinase